MGSDGRDARASATCGPRPVEQRSRALAGIALPPLGRDDVVADLHTAMVIRRRVKADASDHPTRRRDDHGTNQPGLLRRISRQLLKSEPRRHSLLPSGLHTSTELPFDLSQIIVGHSAEQRRRQRDESEARRGNRVSHVPSIAPSTAARTSNAVRRARCRSGSGIARSRSATVPLVARSGTCPPAGLSVGGGRSCG